MRKVLFHAATLLLSWSAVAADNVDGSQQIVEHNKSTRHHQRQVKAPVTEVQGAWIVEGP